MAYTLTATTTIIRDADHAYIPADAGNSDYQAYLAWIAQGNTATPYVAPNTLPAQAQSALTKSDLTVIRCYSAGIAVPTANQVYRNALRAIVTGADTTSTTLPTEPPMPMGI